MPRFRDEAVVLQTRQWSETSQIVVLLTQTRGKVRGLAKGAKRNSPSSLQRFSGGFEMLTTGQVLCRTRSTGELASITEWDLHQAHSHFRENLAAQWIGMYAAELTEAMLADLDPHPRTFVALEHTLSLLEADRGAALVEYQWTLLDDCGYRPELDHDVHGGERLAGRERYAFDPLAGGLTTRLHQPGTWGVRAQTVELLRAMAAGESVGANTEYHEPIQRANRLLAVYARTILDREINTMRLLWR